MTFYKSNGDRVPDHIRQMAEETKTGKMDRREFLALASVFGASTAMAYGMIGLAAPTPAQAAEPKKGGTLKVAMWIKDPKDPRKSDWSEIANAERQALGIGDFRPVGLARVLGILDPHGDLQSAALLGFRGLRRRRRRQPDHAVGHRG